MRTADLVSADKLRGGFYSPAPLVRACLDRVAELAGARDGLRVFEPSAGDGAFVRGLAGHILASRVAVLTAMEISAAEAAACRSALAAAPFPGTVLAGSVLGPSRPPSGRYDVAIGNPPFVRFQFLSREDRQGAAGLAAEAGLPLAGVSNLWIPVLLAALTRLRPGGVFAFLVPAECLTGISARSMRDWLASRAGDLRAELFPAGSFPGALQEVIVLSGRLERPAMPRPAVPRPAVARSAAAPRPAAAQPATARPATAQPAAPPSAVPQAAVAGSAVLRVTEHASPHSPASAPRSWSHRVDPAAPTWTRYLLSPGQLAALGELAGLPQFRPMSTVARLSVSTVTGANTFFSVDDPTLARHGLAAWARPLLPRIRHAAGLTFGKDDHDGLAAVGCARWLLDFAAGLASPQDSPAARGYLRHGEELGLPGRYKCQIRVPWYRVPVVPPGTLLLSKRSHRYPRLVRNMAAAVTTDTIYQGSLLGPGRRPGAGPVPGSAFPPAPGSAFPPGPVPGSAFPPGPGSVFPPGSALPRAPAPAPVPPPGPWATPGEGSEDDLVAGFHNSATLLTAEIEGRSFGGGVLELVPTEIGRLSVPLVPGLGAHLDRLDRLARAAGPDSDALVEETDALLARVVPALGAGLLGPLREARAALLRRRLDRAG